MNSARWIAMLATVTLAGCAPAKAPAPAVDTAKIATDIKADVVDLVAAYNAHDAEKIAAHDAADVVEMFHGAPNTVGAAAVLAAAKAQATMPDANYRVTLADEVVDVAASGEMAVYRAGYVVTYTDPKSKAAGSEKGNYLAGYRKQGDGAWKIAWSVISDTGPSQP